MTSALLRQNLAAATFECRQIGPRLTKYTRDLIFGPKKIFIAGTSRKFEPNLEPTSWLQTLYPSEEILSVANSISSLMERKKLA